jgi:hypothetical protein
VRCDEKKREKRAEVVPLSENLGKQAPGRCLERECC